MSTTNAIIGTAGHVDHGKTSLIKALTGTDTDRLKEEKKRGITIELGFAGLTMPDGQKVGIIDVPGHEKFIKNMLAGAGSVDVALLVIAADEGIMPQTREHLDILRMLKINCGVIALSKSDLVEDEWLEMVAMEIEEEMQGSFLEGAKIIPVSAATGAGVEELRRHLFELLAQSPEKVAANFRLPIDRVFTMEGFGTVVTGTLLEGSLHEDDDITLYPTIHTTRARRIQVFGQLTEVAHPGQRVAVNLAQLKLEDVSRGNVLAPAGSIENSHILDVRLDVLPNIGREVFNNTRVHLYHGTKDLLCRIALIGTAELKPGTSGYAQLQLAEPLAAKCGDPFVIRFYSPLETIGGGIILDPCPKKARNNKETERRLALKENGTLTEKIQVYINERPFYQASYIKNRFFNNCTKFDSTLTELISEKNIFAIGRNLVHNSYIAQIGKRIQPLLLTYHENNPLHKGMAISELRSQIFDATEQDFVQDILKICHEMGLLQLLEDRVAHKTFSIKVNERQQKMREEILQAFYNGSFAPPTIEEVEDNYLRDKKTFKQVFDTLVAGGELVLLTPQIFMHHHFCQQAQDVFISEVVQNGDITLAQFRDIIGTSRKFAVALLEYFDKKKISKKMGDTRILG